MIRLLVVEDEFVTAMLLQKTLRAAGYEVCGLASTGPKAIEKAEAERPDVILMDICLAGEMNGIEAAREIQKRAPVPIIFVSAYADTEIVQQAEALRPLAFLSKPVTCHNIKPIIDSTLRKAS